jgi:arylsulfatase A-like enzyme
MKTRWIPTALSTIWTLTLALALTPSPASAADAASKPAPAAGADARKPNVIFIVADDLGYADIGAQAVSKDVRTPNIDSIASNGARFTSAYVSCPVCSPSRAGFLTGRYQERFGHETNPAPKFDGTFGLPLDQVTLADELKRLGYATGMVGKWHLGSQPDYRPPRRGFDFFFGFLGGAHGYLNPGQGVNAIRRGDEPVDEKEYLTDAFTREALSFIDRNKDRPFFLYLPYNAVHTPQAAPPKYQRRFEDEKDPKRKLMLAMLAAEDDGVGKILAKLRDAGLEEKTLVVFFSDNGGPTQANASRNAPFRGFKGQVWEGGIRIPFMVQWKGRIPPGQVLDQPIISLDLFPTALAAAGVPEPRKQLRLDGVNLLPLLQGKTTDRPHQTLYWRMKPQWAVRDGDMKLLHTRGGDTMLFDLAADPGETRDLAKEKPDIAKRLREKFDAWNEQLMAPRWPGKQEGARFEKAARKGLPAGAAAGKSRDDDDDE